MRGGGRRQESSFLQSLLKQRLGVGTSPLSLEQLQNKWGGDVGLNVKLELGFNNLYAI